MKDLYNFIDINNHADLALWASFLLAFYCLFRKSNVAPKSLHNFNPNKELSRKKLSYLADLNIVHVYSNYSKTNQFMSREITIPLCENKVQAMDPVFHLRKLLEWDISEESPAFSYFESGSLKCITYSSFTLRLKQLLSLAGYAPELFSGHSMRRGGATLLFQLNCNPMIIQAVGGWTKDQYLKYCSLSLDQRYQAQLLMCSAS